MGVRGPRRGPLGSQHEREVATREAALLEFPLGMEVCRELKDKEGNIILSRGKICDFYDPYWRVEFSNGNWEELTRRELRHGITLAAQVSSLAQEV